MKRAQINARLIEFTPQPGNEGGAQMIGNSKKAILMTAALCATFALAMAGARAQSGGAAQSAGTPAAAPAQNPPPSMVGKKAGEYFKNVQVLKDLDADKLQPSMQFIGASLGVDCEFCHVQEKDANGRNRSVFEKDDKREKVTARHMMQMTADINKSSFDGNRGVTCNTCHRGSASPAGIPAVKDTDGDNAPPAAASATPPATAPTAAQILDKYLQASGGADALAKITTRSEKGHVLVGQNSTPIDVLAKAPNKRVSVSHGQNGDSYTAFDGTAGWLGGGRGARDMNAIDSQSAMVDAALSFPANLKTVFPQMRVRTDKIGDKEFYVINARGPNTPNVRLYFDEQSGLLTRVIRYNDVGMGFMPVQVDYTDYRDADGVKIPFRWTLSRPGGRFSIQIDSVQQNVPIDDSKFAKPAASPAPGQ